jgi:RNA-directed DNA polymerase
MIDNEIYLALMRWAFKRHARKGKPWIVKKYFTTLEEIAGGFTA